jgi:hypothetical protein
MHQHSLHPSKFLWYRRCSDRVHKWQKILIVASTSQHLTAFLQLKSMIRSIPQNAVTASQRLHPIEAHMLHQLAVIYWRSHLSLSLYDVCPWSMNWSPLAQCWRLKKSFLLDISLRPKLSISGYWDIVLLRYQSTKISVYSQWLIISCSIQAFLPSIFL